MNLQKKKKTKNGKKEEGLKLIMCFENSEYEKVADVYVFCLT